MPVLTFSLGRRIGLFGLGALLSGLLIACGGGGGGSANVPSGFTHCSQSGDVTKISDKDTAGEWQYQQSHGATGGDIEVYAASSSDCEGMPDIRSGSKKIIASAVITFKDSASASAGYNGMFGVGSSSVAKAPGAKTGSATGFGGTSVYAYSSGESAAAWVSGTKVVAVIAENVSESDFKNYANGLK